MFEIPSIQSAINTIRGTFGKDYGRMDFIFTHRFRSHRTVLTVLRSLPGLSLKVTDDQSPDISFESTWIADPNLRKKDDDIPQEGWESIATTSWRSQYSYLAHTFMNIRKVREVAIFDYGFEFLAADRMELIGIKSSAWKDSSITYLQSIVGEQFKGIRFADDIDDELKMAWRHPVVIEKARQVAEKQRAFVQVGQSFRDLLLDDDDV